MTEALAFYTSAELADLLRLNHQVVQRKLQAGEIPAYRIGREWRVERSQLMEWLESRSNQRDPLAHWFTADGRLTAIPTKRSVRQRLLARIIDDFEPDRAYPEREVNAILRRYHDDVAFLRREMVTEGHFVRARSVYKRTGSSARSLEDRARHRAV